MKQDLQRAASLVLRDGSVFEGRLLGAGRPTAGEVVFNTGMVGYPESLTDPSYYGQILVFTYPLIGNYGVPAVRQDEYGIAEKFESDRIQVRALVVSTAGQHDDHWEAGRTLADWLAADGIPCMEGIDTRALTMHLRERGTLLGKIVVEGEPDPQWYDPAAEPIVPRVSRTSSQTFGDAGTPHIVVVDCGAKNNILRSLLVRGARVTVVPWDHDLSSIDYDGLLVTNGPGDPEQCRGLVDQLTGLIDDPRPILGICLGCQLLGLAAGGRSFKLPYGHRGQNQPVIEAGTGRTAITSQNHGYVVDKDSLPADWEVWFTNVNDGTLEGLKYRHGPHRGVQFHPEAAGGPVDTGYLFDNFLDDVRNAQGGNH